MAQHTVFVYGTLKKGQPNHHHVVSDTGRARYLGQAQTVHEWPLVVAGNLKIPYLLHCKDVGKNIIGELYEVDDNMLERFDILEGHPYIYERDTVVVEVIGSEEEQDVHKDSQEDYIEDTEEDHGVRQGIATVIPRRPHYFSPQNSPRQIANNLVSGQFFSHISGGNKSNSPLANRKRKSNRQVKCITYFMKRFRPELLSFPFIDDYNFKIHGQVSLPRKITGAEIKKELALVMKSVVLPSKL